MESFDFPHDPTLAGFDYDSSRAQRLACLPTSVTWPSTADQRQESAMSPSQQPPFDADGGLTDNAINFNSTRAPRRASVSTVPVQTPGLAFQQPPINPSAAFLAGEWQQLQQLQQQQQTFFQDANLQHTYSQGFGTSLTSSPVDFMPPSSTTMDPTMAGAPFLHMPASMETMEAMNSFRMNDLNEMMTYPMMNNNNFSNMDAYSAAVTGTSPTESWLEVRSLSDQGWNMVDMNGPPSRQSFESYDAPSSAVFNPSQTLHIRTSSDSTESDVALSAHSGSSFEEVLIGSPSSDSANHEYFFSQPSPNPIVPKTETNVMSSSAPSSVSPPAAAPPALARPAPTASSSPSSSDSSSPPSRRRRSPSDRSADAVIKKVQAPVIKKESNDKKVGKRKGPLRPEQRQQAHEIRKLRACLRCKFLKKTCDKGDPCAGCKPSHTRLWQVPCTRIDIKDIGYFMKDWKADYERHVTLGFSVQNIKGFSNMERTLFITHGYGHYLCIQAREVYVRDEKCFGLDWVETHGESPEQFEVPTARLSAGMDGISSALLSEYLDNHIDGDFMKFIDDYFEGTKFLTEILKTAYRYYLREHLPVIRKALKLVLAYNLTLHVTLIEGLSEDESFIGKIDDMRSKYHGKTLAPVMINFQVKTAMADMWRELQKDILEELSQLYSSVYSKDKLKNWPTIFILATVLLAVWELMQFDSHYRVPDQAAVEKFCNDMETTPVGVIVGLFTAISQKLPAFNEWDTRKHHHSLNSNPAVCDAMTEVRSHVNKYENYLKSRQSAEFDRNDFDCLSNKFLSKLVIRAN